MALIQLGFNHGGNCEYQRHNWKNPDKCSIILEPIVLGI